MATKHGDVLAVGRPSRSRSGRAPDARRRCRKAGFEIKRAAPSAASSPNVGACVAAAGGRLHRQPRWSPEGSRARRRRAGRQPDAGAQPQGRLIHSEYNHTVQAVLGTARWAADDFSAETRSPTASTTVARCRC